MKWPSTIAQIGVMLAAVGLAAASWQPERQYSGGGGVEKAGTVTHDGRTKLAGSIMESLRATPFIRVHTQTTTETGEVLWCKSWMSRDMLRTEVSRDAKQVFFAKYRDSQRVQEYAPRAVFHGGATEASEVLIEYGAADAGTSKLIDYALGCRFGLLTESWLSPNALIAEAILAVVQSEEVVGEEQLDGRPCYVFRLDQPQGNSHVLHVDRSSLDLVRWVRVQATEINGSRTLLTRQNDFKIEHLDSDAGWKWRLHVEQFRAEPPHADLP